MQKTTWQRVLKIIFLSLGLTGLLLSILGYTSKPASYDDEMFWILKNLLIVSIILILTSFFFKGNK